MTREPFLDVVRGLGLLLMVLDHVAVVWDFPPLVRDVTRLAMPFFMVTAGFLVSGGLSWRYADVVFAAVISWPLAVSLGLAEFPILLVFALVYPLATVSPGWLPSIAAGALLQVQAWPIGWMGYEPGYVLVFLILGRLVRLAGYSVPAWRVPGWLCLVGRYSLSLYVFHLLAIKMLEVLIQNA